MLQAAAVAQATAAAIARGRASEEARLSAQAALYAQQAAATNAKEAPIRAVQAKRAAELRVLDAYAAIGDEAIMRTARRNAAQAAARRANPTSTVAIADGSPGDIIDAHHWPTADSAQALDGAFSEGDATALQMQPSDFAADAIAPASITSGADEERQSAYGLDGGPDRLVEAEATANPGRGLFARLGFAT